MTEPTNHPNVLVAADKNMCKSEVHEKVVDGENYI